MFINIFLLSIVSALFAGGLCGAVGFHVQRFGVTTMSFGIAHAALAGAALGLLLGVDSTMSAMLLALIIALFMGIVLIRISYGRELISMAIFSASSAIALFAIYVSSAKVLATTSVAIILWGSLLAITFEKLVLLITLSILFSLYIVACRVHIDAILYDKKLAEAEGVNVQLHTLILLFFTGAVIAIALKLTGGFLVFTLLYNPVATALQIAKSARKQLVLSSILGSISAITGLIVSYIIDLPVGATIALTSTTILIITCITRISIEKIKWKINKLS